MSPKVAVWVLTGFALIFSAASLWGVLDIVAWLEAMRECKERIVFETSSFWFVGFLANAGLPFLAVFKAPKEQKVLLSVLVVWFVVAPLIAHQYFVWRGESLGYDVSAASSPFGLKRAELINQRCLHRNDS